MILNDSNPRCQGQTKKGKPCRAAATEGGLCFFHANPKKAVELGRLGGRKNARPAVILEPLPNLDSVAAVQDALKRMISDVYSGKLHPRIVAGLAPLLNLQLRAIEKTEFEQRIAKIERLLEKMKPNLDRTEKTKPSYPGEGVFARQPPEAFPPYDDEDGETTQKS